VEQAERKKLVVKTVYLSRKQPDAVRHAPKANWCPRASERIKSAKTRRFGRFFSLDGAVRTYFVLSCTIPIVRI